MRFLLLTLILALALPAAAHARDATVTSFDGTQLVVHLFPASDDGAKHPTVLSGHGWGGTGSTNPDSASNAAGTVGNGPLRKAGYNVVTWDARGFGNSGGTVTVDAPDAEARDVQAILTWLAEQPEAQLDAPGDPRVAMVGSSYGGGIQLVTAGLPGEKRIDAIVPDIAWQSLQTSLYQDDTLKGGWASLLTGAGIPASKNRLDSHITTSFTEASATGALSPENRDWFISRGPGDLVNNIRIPTLLTQGTVDTLFPLDEAVTNYGILRANGVPVKMMWHCGGHGTCTTPGGNGQSPLETRVLQWLKRYLDGDKSVNTGPRFEWVADDGTWRSGPDYPLASTGALSATGKGSLVLAPGAGQGSPLAAAPDDSGFSLAIPAPRQATQVVGAPKLELIYTATGASPVPRVYAQIADLTHNVVLGNQVTPVPLELDGKEHTIERPLEMLAATATPDSRYALQLVSASGVYAGQGRTSANVDLAKVEIALPTVDPNKAGTAPKPKVAVKLQRASKRKLRARVTVERGVVQNLRITVRRGKRVVATGKVKRLEGRKTVSLKSTRKAGKGKLEVSVRWTDARGQSGSLNRKVTL